MALLSIQTITTAGIVPTLAAVAASDTFVANKGTFLEVTNGGGAPTTVTVNSLKPDEWGTDVNLVVTVDAGATKRFYLGDDQASRFNSPTTGVATVTCSPTTSVTIGVFRI